MASLIMLVQLTLYEQLRSSVVAEGSEKNPSISQRQRLEAFLADLGELSAKHQIVVTQASDSVVFFDLSHRSVIGEGLSTFKLPSAAGKISCVPHISILDGDWPQWLRGEFAL